MDTTDLIVPQVAADSPLGVDVYVDATPSMEGFIKEADSTYVKFLDDLEGSLVSGLKNVSDVRYFKFGQAIREVSRPEFRDARREAFYHEPGIFKDTNIDLVFQEPVTNRRIGTEKAAEPSKGGRPRVTVVVTDLFQKDQDANAVVRAIRDHCLVEPACSVGVLAVASPFNGTVYDARVPNYSYASSADPSSYRPFYLLMFGPQEQLVRFVDVLSARPYIDSKRFVLIAPRLMQAFEVSLKRDKDAKGLTPRKSEDSPLDTAFNLRKEFESGAITARIVLKPHPAAFGVNIKQLQFRGYKISGGAPVPAGVEFKADSITADGSVIVLKVTLRPPPTKGEYVYVGEIAVGDVNGVVLPGWVTDLSSNNPMPGHEPMKTMNLDRFIGDLIATSILQDHHQPKLARFRVLLNRL